MRPHDLQLREYNRQLGPKGLVFYAAVRLPPPSAAAGFTGRAMLERELAAPQAAAMLEQLGYPMEENLQGQAEPPAGLFCRRRGASPMRSVCFWGIRPRMLAFVATGGAGCKLCGYWKVYHNGEAARACFCPV